VAGIGGEGMVRYMVGVRSCTFVGLRRDLCFDKHGRKRMVGMSVVV
jgi:hypothetical protein